MKHVPDNQIQKITDGMELHVPAIISEGSEFLSTARIETHGQHLRVPVIVYACSSLQPGFPTKL